MYLLTVGVFIAFLVALIGTWARVYRRNRIWYQRGVGVSHVYSLVATWFAWVTWLWWVWEQLQWAAGPCPRGFPLTLWYKLSSSQQLEISHQAAAHPEQPAVRLRPY